MNYTVHYTAGYLFTVHTTLDYISQLVVQVFHWGQPVGNYAFLESRDQCLQGRLGAIVVSRPVSESR